MNIQSLLVSFAIGSAPIEAIPLQSPLDACAARDAAVSVWRSNSHAVFSTAIAGWCIASRVDGEMWIAEQWQDLPPSERGATNKASRSIGWRSRIPLKAFMDFAAAGQSRLFGFPDLSAHLRVQSFKGLSVAQAHGQVSRQLLGPVAPPAALSDGSPLISRGPGATLVSVPGDAGGSYAISIVEGRRK